jgi:cell division protease FtsH
MQRHNKITLVYVVLVLLGMLVFPTLLQTGPATEEIPYSTFLTLVDQGKVTDLVVGPSRIRGAYKDPPAGSPARFTTIRVQPDLADRLAKADVKVTGEPEPGLLSAVLAWLMPAIGFAVVWMLLIRPMGGGAGSGGLMSIGRSKAKVYVEKGISTSFADVAGVDEAKEELKEVVSFLKDPQAYGRLGAHVPKGVLLVGPPGTGKTLLARAVAGEAGVPFFSISGSEFVEMFVGVGAARVRDLFEQARANAPAIVFIDELDALGRARGSLLPGGGHDEKEQTLNQLLSEMDGFDPTIGVVLLAATNRPEILDPALLRAGRFDRQVLVDRPDKTGRAQILAVHLKKIRLAPSVPVDELAGLTAGFTGADLANLVNEAAILATRRKGDSVSMEDFTQAIERIVAGLEKRNRLLNPRERRVVAFHEMGHALVALAQPGSDPIQKVSIIPRGVTALGYTIQRPLEDRFLMDRAELMRRMTVLLGGRAAESLVFDEVSTGAADDLAKATEIARGMVMRFGMDEKIGQVSYESEGPTFLGGPAAAAADWRPRPYGEATADAIDGAVRALIHDAFEAARAILQQRRPLLDQSAEVLLRKETLSADELAAIGAEAVRPSGGRMAAVQ